MLLGIVEDLLGDLAADVIARLLAELDRLDQRGAAALLQLQIRRQAFRHRLANRQFAQVLQVRQAF